MTRRARTAEDAASFNGMGRAVTQLRREAGMTQSALAIQAEVSAVAVGAIERGEAEATWATLRRIAKGLNVPLFDLLSLAEELAPGDGGARWRRWSAAAQTKRAS
jgi:transcriptional regulator with XRE-family HTH domain